MHNYVQEHNRHSKSEIFAIIDEYVDDGKSATSTKERTSFNRMTDDILSGKINCVIVKDFSRFARNNADQSFYLNKFFPTNRTRFISVLDNYDNVEEIYSEYAEILGVLNEQRSRKASQNVKNIFKLKANRGDFIGAFTCYGYKRDPENKNHLIIDLEAANVVKRIFDEFLHGVGQITIANNLNNDKIPCPSEYKKQQGLNYQNNNSGNICEWTYSTIHNILKNKMLVGDMWQHRENKSKFIDKRYKYDVSEHIVVANTHEAIISRDDFEKVQNKLNNTRDLHGNFNQNISIYAGHLKCECGRPMAKIINNYKGKKTVRYVCKSYKNGAKTSACTSHRIFQDDIDEVVLAFLNDMVKQIKKINDVIKKASKTKNSKQNLNAQQLIKNKKALDGIDAKKERLLDLYLAKKLNMEMFEKKENELKAEKERLESVIRQLESVDTKTEEEMFLADPLISELLKHGKFLTLTKEIIDTFIDKIIVHEDENKQLSLEIIPTFKKTTV